MLYIYAETVNELHIFLSYVVPVFKSDVNVGKTYVMFAPFNECCES